MQFSDVTPLVSKFNSLLSPSESPQRITILAVLFQTQKRSPIEQFVDTIMAAKNELFSIVSFGQEK